MIPDYTTQNNGLPPTEPISPLETLTLNQRLLKLLEKIFKGCIGCAVSFVLIFGLIFGGLSYLVAKTGLIKIPLLSNAVFHVPAPWYAVRVAAVSDWQQKIEASLLEQPTVQNKELIISENELTAWLQKLYQENKNASDFLQEYQYLTLQVAVQNDRAQIYAHLIPQNTDELIKNVYLNLILSVLPGKDSISVSQSELHLGQLKIPSSLTKSLIDDKINENLKQNFDLLKQAQIEITMIKLEEGRLKINYRLSL